MNQISPGPIWRPLLSLTVLKTLQTLLTAGSIAAAHSHLTEPNLFESNWSFGFSDINPVASAGFQWLSHRLQLKPSFSAGVRPWRCLETARRWDCCFSFISAEMRHTCLFSSVLLKRYKFPPRLSVWIFSLFQSLSGGEGDQLRHLVHLQLPHSHHHAGPHLALAALPLPRLQVSARLSFFLFFSFLLFLLTVSHTSRCVIISVAHAHILSLR